ncbi:type VI secretion system Vgr family protein [Sorangium sp. So ce1335]|uniref:type VI secretion system Vgr family protein n=1 Tax=Sorangium sp. So ce1335 TaxID=3133335 RepID=UPI003F6043F5
MSFAKTPEQDHTQEVAKATVDGSDDAAIAGIAGELEKVVTAGKVAIDAASMVRAPGEGRGAAVGEMVAGAVAGPMAQAIGDKVDGLAGDKLPGVGRGITERITGAASGIAGGELPGGPRATEMPVAESKRIASSIERRAAGAIPSKALGLGDPAGFTGPARAGIRELGGGRGASAGTEISFAWEGASGPEGPWSHLRVVSVRGTEALSSLYHYEITALIREPAPEIDPDGLIQARATLRFTTTTEPMWRVVHGLVVEAEELGPVPGGMCYRIVLAPPLLRAMHRTRCRIFLGKTTRQIVDAVLQGDPELSLSAGATVQPDGGDDTQFSAAKELYTWRITDVSRIDDIATREYCVQYNESDFAFICRLLEEEGISWHHENGDGTCLLVLSDKDSGRARLDPFDPLGPGVSGRAVQSMKLGARMRPRKVSLLDYNWKQPTLNMAIAEPARAGGADLVYHQYPGRYTEAPAMGKPLATATFERLAVEASYAVGESTCRALAAGSIFALEHPQPRYEGEYLVTKIEVRAEQAGVLPPGAAVAMPLPDVPYAVTFECARRGKNGTVAESSFRPARVTPRPRIHGSQTAFVTAEPNMEGTEIHVGGPKGAEIGCVRVKFHWDQDTERHAKEPTSCWVRVSQVFAGVGEGAVFHPRVGVEVIVDFEEGDPDRPIIVGRVYNGRNRPPSGAKTVSTFKTMSSPATGAFNELTFDDTAGKEQIRMHTPYNWSSHAGNDRSETIDQNSNSRVGTDRTESTGSNRRFTVGKNNSETVVGNESVTVGVNQTVTIGEKQKVTVGGPQEEAVRKGRKTEIKITDELKVIGKQDVEVTGPQSTKVGETQDVEVTGVQTTKFLASASLTVANKYEVSANTSTLTFESGKVDLAAANEISLHNAAGDVKITSGAGKVVIEAASEITLTCGTASVRLKNDGTVSISGSSSVGLGSGSAAVKLEPAGVTSSGPKVTTSAVGICQISGALVKIN